MENRGEWWGGIYRLREREREGVTWGVGQKRARALGSGSGGNCVKRNG